MGHAILTRTEGRVLELTLNRPEAGNAFDEALVEELLAALDSIDGDACDTVVFRGSRQRLLRRARPVGARR